MYMFLTACFLLISPFHALSNGQAISHKGNSMIAKVIEMLGEEKEKIGANIAAETTTMAEYTQWCDDTMTEKSYAIKSATSKIAELTAVITDATAQIHGLDEDIATLGNEIAERNSEMEEATAVRAKDHEEFAKAEAEQAQMIEELQELEVTLKKQMAAMTTPPPVGVEEEGEPAEGAPAFLQLRDEPTGARLQKLRRAMARAVNSIWVDPESKKNLALLDNDGTFLQQPAGGAGATNHLAEANEEKNDDLAAFEGLTGKAEEALQRLRDEEVKKQSEHDLAMMTLKQAVALAENNLDDTKREHARISQEKAEATEELAETEAAKASDEKALASVTAECNAAAEAWATRQSEAKAEQAAIEKAKEILSARVTVFIQVVNSPSANSIQAKTRAKLVSHFRALGNKLHSLAMLNLVSVASSDPMEQVKGLLNSLIEKLMKEAKDAADLHEFCKAEKAKTSAAIKKKSMTIEELDARLEKASSKKQQLEESIADLSDEIAEMDKSQAEATKLRNEENANFVKVSTDFTGAAEAVDDAIDALKEYYGSVSLMQSGVDRKSSKAPPQLGGAKSDSAGGIISILETMGEEFRKTVKEAKAEERAALAAYEKMVQENKESKASKTAEISGSESEIKSLGVAIHNFGSDKKMTSGELASVNDYVAKLKPQCGGRTVPYEERKAKRDAEIQGLKDALAILESDSPAGAFNFLQINLHH
jgi:DNA repair exonuclease SbcCD ATPase subunit